MPSTPPNSSMHICKLWSINIAPYNRRQKPPMVLPALDEELHKMKSELADLSSRYTERHPDVRKLKEQVAKTEKMREQILTDLKARSVAAQNDNSSASSAP